MATMGASDTDMQSQQRTPAAAVDTGNVLVGSRRGATMATLGQLALSFGILLAVWWLLSAGIASNVLPHPPRAFEAIATLTANGELPSALWTTIPGLLIGLFAATIVGAVAGLLMGLIAPLDRLMGPWLYVFWSMPIVAALPLVVLTFGIGVEAVTFYVFLSSLFPVVMNARSGAKHTDRRLIEVARSMGARQREILVHVVIPSSLPPMAAGFRIAIGRAVVGVIIAQLFISAAGIGRMLQFYGETLQMELYFAPLLTTIAIGLILNGLADVGEKRLVRWQET
ncbi:MAG: ABC transporter permease subunit [Actinobacteria bacterium]|nr:ABC transporter permease subunit [Actinomycetota bacterium]